MKPIALFIVSLVLMSCTPEILKNDPQIKELNIQPPSWIQGTWAIKDPNVTADALKFTSDDFLKINENNEEISVLVGYKFIQLLGGTVTVQEYNQADQYILKFDYTDETLGSGGEDYTFIKSTSSELTWNGIIYTKI